MKKFKSDTGFSQQNVCKWKTNEVTPNSSNFKIIKNWMIDNVELINSRNGFVQINVDELDEVKKDIEMLEETSVMEVQEETPALTWKEQVDYICEKKQEMGEFFLNMIKEYKLIQNSYDNKEAIAGFWKIISDVEFK